MCIPLDGTQLSAVLLHHPATNADIFRRWQPGVKAMIFCIYLLWMGRSFLLSSYTTQLPMVIFFTIGRRDLHLISSTQIVREA